MKLVRILLLPLAFLCVALIRILYRFGVVVRMGELWSERIGHLVGNSECYLCERDEGLHKAIDLWTHAGNITNKQVAKMLSRAMYVDPTRFVKLVALCNHMFEGWQYHTVGPKQWDRDIHNLFEKHPPHLKFTASEERRGERQLKAMGVRGKFVCLIVRDSAFFASHKDMAHHTYRDSDIQTYMLACLELVSRGYTVIRMGAKVDKPLPIKHTKVIDYATNGMRSDFMDVYLGAKCSFCVSTGTGFDSIPYAFRRPICYVNFVPVEYLFTFVQNSVAIWKHHHKDGKRMTFNEIIDSGAGQFMDREQFIEAGITLKDNTPEEIRDAVLEMCQPSTVDQQWFWDQFPIAISPFNARALHGEIRMRIGSKFLESYK